MNLSLIAVASTEACGEPQLRSPSCGAPADCAGLYPSQPPRGLQARQPGTCSGFASVIWLKSVLSNSCKRNIL